VTDKQNEPQPYQYKVYDTSFKSLLQDQPRETLSFFVGGIEYQEELSEKALKPSLTVDSIFLVKRDGVLEILHLEIETEPKSEMPHRMLEYYGILYRK